MHTGVSRQYQWFMGILVGLSPILFLSCADQTTVTFRQPQTVDPSREPAATPVPLDPTPTSEQPTPATTPTQPSPSETPATPAQPTPTATPDEDPSSFNPDPSPTPEPSPTEDPENTPAPAPSPSPAQGGFGCITTDTGDVATSEDLDALLGDVPERISGSFVTIDGPVTWTQGAISGIILRLEVFFIDPDRGAIDLGVDRFGLGSFTASEVGCGGATQPGSTCNFNLTLPLGLLSISGPGDYDAVFTFRDRASSEYACTRSFSF